jgi:CIC family chloride channel protein
VKEHLSGGYSRFTAWFQKFYLNTDLSRYVTHILISIILGLAAGLCAVAFHHLLAMTETFFKPAGSAGALTLRSFSIVFLPVAGALIIATMTRTFKDIARQKGVLSVIKALILNNGFIPFRVTLFHFIAPIISIGTGAPLGPETPAAKLGSGIGSFMSQIFRLGKNDMRMYTAAGAGAAISAIFNAPFAGVFFGIEVMLLNDLKNQALSALIISSVIADIISKAVLGNAHVITIPAYRLSIVSEIHLFILLGVVCGLASLLFFMLMKLSETLVRKRLSGFNEYMLLVPVALVFGFVLIPYYELFGLGYSTINDVIHQRLASPGLIAVLFALKIVFVALFLNAGSYGGTFAPSLSLGVFVGYLFAAGMNAAFSLNLDPVTFSLVSMGGILAGINSIPLTSIILVIELTGDYKFILPLMLVSIVSYLVTLYFNRGTVYTNELMEIGIDVTKRGEMDLLGRIRVRDLMSPEFDSVSHRAPFPKMMESLMSSKNGDVIVVNDTGSLRGMVTLRDVRDAIASSDLVDLLIAGDIAQPVPAVLESDRVSDAMRKIERYDLESIPVMGGKEGSTIAGILTRHDIIQAYNRLLQDWETDQFLVDYRASSRRQDGE